MKLVDLVNKQTNNTMVNVYVNGKLNCTVNTEYLKTVLNGGDSRASLTVSGFYPDVFHHYSGVARPTLVIHVKE